MSIYRDRNPHPTFYIYSDTLPKHWSGRVIHPPPWARKEGSGIEATGWRRSLAQAAWWSCSDGPVASRIEVHSHGAPGAIMLNPAVTYANVALFAGLLKRLLRPGGVIELLCCLVARPDLDGLAAAAQARGDASTVALCRRLGADIVEAEGGRSLVLGPPSPATSVVAAAKPTGPSFGGLVVTPPPASGRLTPNELTGLLKASIATRIPGNVERSTGNGPLFCAELARLTGSRVRAALGRQFEEASESDGAGRSYMAVGSWEGHVADFTPDGGVGYAGYDLPRQMFPQLELIGGPTLAA